MTYWKFYHQEEQGGAILQCAPNAWTLEKAQEEYKRLTEQGARLTIIKCEDVTKDFAND